MIPTMIAAGLIIGFIPRWWPRNLAVIVVLSLLSLLASVAWGLVVEEPVFGTGLAIVNTVIGFALGRLLQLAIPPPHRQRVH